MALPPVRNRKAIRKGKAEMEKLPKRLVIRFFMNGFFLCNGQPPKGVEPEPDEIYVGETVKWFETWEEANNMLNMINEAYGYEGE